MKFYFKKNVEEKLFSNVLLSYLLTIYEDIKQKGSIIFILRCK
nr:MAG TPA: GRIP-related Arf-binding domain [Inoviridae sp.]